MITRGYHPRYRQMMGAMRRRRGVIIMTPPERIVPMLHPTHEDREQEERLADAYALGEMARYSGRQYNPYRRGGIEWQEWWLGWDYAGKEDGRGTRSVDL